MLRLEKNINKIKMNLSKIINLSSIEPYLNNDIDLKFKIYNAFAMGKDFSYDDIKKLKRFTTSISFPLYRGVYIEEVIKYNLNNININDNFTFDRLTSFSSLPYKAESFTISERTFILLKSNKSKEIFPFVDALEYCIRNPVEEMFKLSRNPKSDLDYFLKNISNNDKKIEEKLAEQEYFVFENSKFMVTNIIENYQGKYGKLKIIEGNIN